MSNAPRPVPINPIIAETPEEKKLFARGELNSKRRKQLTQTSLIKHTPNDLESDLIHAYWQKQLQYHGMADPDTRSISLQTSPNGCFH